MSLPPLPDGDSTDGEFASGGSGRASQEASEEEQEELEEEKLEMIDVAEHAPDIAFVSLPGSGRRINFLWGDAGGGKEGAKAQGANENEKNGRRSGENTALAPESRVRSSLVAVSNRFGLVAFASQRFSRIVMAKTSNVLEELFAEDENAGDGEDDVSLFADGFKPGVRVGAPLPGVPRRVDFSGSELLISVVCEGTSASSGSDQVALFDVVRMLKNEPGPHETFAVPDARLRIADLSWCPGSTQDRFVVACPDSAANSSVFEFVVGSSSSLARVPWCKPSATCTSYSPNGSLLAVGYASGHIDLASVSAAGSQASQTRITLPFPGPQLGDEDDELAGRAVASLRWANSTTLFTCYAAIQFDHVFVLHDVAFDRARGLLESHPFAQRKLYQEELDGVTGLSEIFIANQLVGPWSVLLVTGSDCTDVEVWHAPQNLNEDWAQIEIDDSFLIQLPPLNDGETPSFPRGLALACTSEGNPDVLLKEETDDENLLGQKRRTPILFVVSQAGENLHAYHFIYADPEANYESVVRASQQLPANGLRIAKTSTVSTPALANGVSADSALVQGVQPTPSNDVVKPPLGLFPSSGSLILPGPKPAVVFPGSSQFSSTGALTAFAPKAGIGFPFGAGASSLAKADVRPSTGSFTMGQGLPLASSASFVPGLSSMVPRSSASAPASSTAATTSSLSVSSSLRVGPSTTMSIAAPFLGGPKVSTLDLSASSASPVTATQPSASTSALTGQVSSTFGGSAGTALGVGGSKIAALNLPTVVSSTSGARTEDRPVSSPAASPVRTSIPTVLPSPAAASNAAAIAALETELKKQRALIEDMAAKIADLEAIEDEHDEILAQHQERFQVQTTMNDSFRKATPQPSSLPPLRPHDADKALLDKNAKLSELFENTLSSFAKEMAEVDNLSERISERMKDNFADTDAARLRLRAILDGTAGPESLRLSDGAVSAVTEHVSMLVRLANKHQRRTDTATRELHETTQSIVDCTSQANRSRRLLQLRSDAEYMSALARRKLDPEAVRLRSEITRRVDDVTAELNALQLRLNVTTGEAVYKPPDSVQDMLQTAASNYSKARQQHKKLQDLREEFERVADERRKKRAERPSLSRGPKRAANSFFVPDSEDESESSSVSELEDESQESDSIQDFDSSMYASLFVSGARAAGARVKARPGKAVHSLSRRLSHAFKHAPKRTTQAASPSRTNVAVFVDDFNHEAEQEEESEGDASTSDSVSYEDELTDAEADEMLSSSLLAPRTNDITRQVIQQPKSGPLLSTVSSVAMSPSPDLRSSPLLPQAVSSDGRLGSPLPKLASPLPKAGFGIPGAGDVALPKGAVGAAKLPTVPAVTLPRASAANSSSTAAAALPPLPTATQRIQTKHANLNVPGSTAAPTVDALGAKTASPAATSVTRPAEAIGGAASAPASAAALPPLPSSAQRAQTKVANLAAPDVSTGVSASTTSSTASPAAAPTAKVASSGASLPPLPTATQRAQTKMANLSLPGQVSNVPGTTASIGGVAAAPKPGLGAFSTLGSQGLPKSASPNLALPKLGSPGLAVPKLGVQGLTGPQSSTGFQHKLGLGLGTQPAARSTSGTTNVVGAGTFGAQSTTGAASPSHSIGNAGLPPLRGGMSFLQPSPKASPQSGMSSPLGGLGRGSSLQGLGGLAAPSVTQVGFGSRSAIGGGPTPAPVAQAQVGGVFGSRSQVGGTAGGFAALAGAGRGTGLGVSQPGMRQAGHGQLSGIGQQQQAPSQSGFGALASAGPGLASPTGGPRQLFSAPASGGLGYGQQSQAPSAGPVGLGYGQQMQGPSASAVGLGYGQQPQGPSSSPVGLGGYGQQQQPMVGYGAATQQPGLGYGQVQRTGTMGQLPTSQGYGDTSSAQNLWTPRG